MPDSEDFHWESHNEGFVSTPEAVKQVIDEYEEETRSKFVSIKKDKLFGSDTNSQGNAVKLLQVTGHALSKFNTVSLYICIQKLPRKSQEPQDRKNLFCKCKKGKPVSKHSI